MNEIKPRMDEWHCDKCGNDQHVATFGRMEIGLCHECVDAMLINRNECYSYMKELYTELELLREFKRRVESEESQLHSLLYCVETKYPDETRYETAMRYIRTMEKSTSNAAQASLEGDAEDKEGIEDE